MSRKKYFDVLYLSSNINDNVLEIFLASSITYKDYFCLTKLIHSAFINHQYGINNFIKKNKNTVFLSLNNSLYNATFFPVMNVAFCDLKKCFTRLKKSAITNFKIVKDYNEAINNEMILNFIEDLANSDIRYKNGSIRQIKSHYIRQSNLYKKNYCNLIANEIFIDSTSLIFKYYSAVKELSSCHQYCQQSNTSQSMEEKFPKTLPQTTNSEILVPIESEQSFPIKEPETNIFSDFDLLF
jgi:hypothetical protein